MPPILNKKLFSKKSFYAENMTHKEDAENMTHKEDAENMIYKEDAENADA